MSKPRFSFAIAYVLFWNESLARAQCVSSHILESAGGTGSTGRTVSLFLHPCKLVPRGQSEGVQELFFIGSSSEGGMLHAH